MDFPDINYYQGMNYIAIFIYRIFEDELKAYRFFHFVMKTEIYERYKDNFNGLLEMIYLCDKYLQIKQPEIWNKMISSQMSCIYFGIPCLLTLQTSSLRYDPTITSFIAIAWDLFLAKGFKAQVILFLYLLIFQKVSLVNLKDDSMMLALKSMDENPLPSISNAGVPKEDIISVLLAITKKDLNSFNFDDTFYDLLAKHFRKVHYPIVQNWEKGSLNSINH